MIFDTEKTAVREDGLQIGYGLIHGNDRIVIIKAGAGGSYTGFEEKYLRIARRLHDAYGCTVLSLSNYASDSFERGDVAVIRGKARRWDARTRGTCPEPLRPWSFPRPCRWR